MPDEFKIGVVEQVDDILSCPGEEIIQTGNFKTILKEAFAEMGADKAGPTSYQDSSHIRQFSLYSGLSRNRLCRFLSFQQDHKYSGRQTPHVLSSASSAADNLKF